MTVVGGAGLVACEVVAETALARIVPADALGPRDGGVRRRCPWRRWWRARCSRPILIASTSLHTSLVVLGAAALLVTVLPVAPGSAGSTS